MATAIEQIFRTKRISQPQKRRVCKEDREGNEKQQLCGLLLFSELPSRSDWFIATCALLVISDLT
jgi:hypothetical protein